MTDRPKPKPISAKKGRNDTRKNGKAFKKPGSPKFTRTPISEVMKCNIGHGVLDRYKRPMTKDEADIYYVTVMQKAS